MNWVLILFLIGPSAMTSSTVGPYNSHDDCAKAGAVAIANSSTGDNRYVTMYYSCAPVAKPVDGDRPTKNIQPLPQEFD